MAAAAALALSSVLVIGNSLRLRLLKPQVALLVKETVNATSSLTLPCGKPLQDVRSLEWDADMLEPRAVGHASFFASLRSISAVEMTRSAFFAVGIFIIGGSVAALWNNALFVRMTPISGYEYLLLAIESALGGLYLGLKAPACSIGAAGSGSALGFLGIACPICNKLLMLLFGGQLLMTYFEPVRPYVGMLGIGFLGWALKQKLSRRCDTSPTVE